MRRALLATVLLLAGCERGRIEKEAGAIVPGFKIAAFKTVEIDGKSAHCGLGSTEGGDPDVGFIYREGAFEWAQIHPRYKTFYEHCVPHLVTLRPLT